MGENDKVVSPANGELSLARVIKRDGRVVDFNPDKIRKTILKAMRNSGVYRPKLAELIVSDAIEKYSKKQEVKTSDIVKFIFKSLNEYGQSLSANSYERYRATKEYQRKKNDIDESILGLISGTNLSVINENSNKDAYSFSTQRDLMAGEVSKAIASKYILDTEILTAHEQGIIHWHDLDYSNLPFTNCCLLNLKDMLQNGTVISNCKIENVRSFSKACTIATQLIAAAASSQYGGISITASALAPYIKSSEARWREIIKKDDSSLTGKQVEALVKKLTDKEVEDGVRTIQYQLSTLYTSNGQSPFVTIFLYCDEEPEYRKENIRLIREIFKQRYEGVPNKNGTPVTPAFPKLVFVVQKGMVSDPGTPDFDPELNKVYEDAIKCVSRRMMPDFLSEKKMIEYYGYNNAGRPNIFPPMGCRSFLTPWINPETNEYQWWARGNCGVVSLNLCDVGLSAGKDLDLFWRILDERLRLCHKALVMRYEFLKAHDGTKGAEVLWRYGGIARLGDDGPGFTSVTGNNRFTISLGYIGLSECVKSLIGKSHTTPEGKEIAVEIMKRMMEACDRWTEERPDYPRFSTYGTPSEGLCDTAYRKTVKRWGKVPGVLDDRSWLTNSFHVDVKEEINAFDKIKFESELAIPYSSGGNVIYVEVPNLEGNLDVLKEIVKYGYETARYYEINSRSGDHCDHCGFSGEIILNKDNQWQCPECGCTDRSKLTVTRRTCGYLGSNLWNDGKTKEIKDRVLHI